MVDAATRLVALLCAHQHNRIIEAGGLTADQALGARGGCAANRADGGQFLHTLGPCQQFRDGAKRLRTKIHIQASENDPYPLLGQVQRQDGEIRAKKLRLINAHHVHALRFGAEQIALAAQVGANGRHVWHRHRLDAAPGMAGDLRGVIAVVEGRFKHGHALPGDQGTRDAANEFLTFTAEHGTHDHFEMTARVRGLKHRKLWQRINSPSGMADKVGEMHRTAICFLLALNLSQAEAVHPLTYDAQPHVVYKSRLKLDAFKQVPNLRVLISNLGQQPVNIGVSCGGAWPVQVLDTKGQAMKSVPHIACTQELNLRVIEPGQTLTLRSFAWSNLRTLSPGRYFWSDGRMKVPFELKP